MLDAPPTRRTVGTMVYAAGAVWVLCALFEFTWLFVALHSDRPGWGKVMHVLNSLVWSVLIIQTYALFAWVTAD